MFEIIYDDLMLLHFVFYFRVQSWEVQASTVQYPIGHRTKQKVVKFILFYFKNCSQQLTYEPELNLSLISEFCSAAFDLAMIDQSCRAEIIKLQAQSSLSLFKPLLRQGFQAKLRLTLSLVETYRRFPFSKFAPNFAIKESLKNKHVFQNQQKFSKSFAIQ